MADKKITALQLRDNVDDDINVPVDDGIQTYRTTSLQWIDYILTKLANAITNVMRVETVSAVKTANYTIASSDGTIRGDDTGGAFTFTLPAVSTMIGKIITLKKVEAATAQYRITIDADGSETIGGALTKKLATPGESYTLVGTSAGWEILHHHYAFTKTFTPVWTDGGGNALTFGTTTVKKGRITRISPKWALLHYDLKMTTAGSGGSVAGLLYKMPQYFQVDLTADGVDAVAGAANYGFAYMGPGEWFYGGSTNYDLRTHLYDTDNFEISTKSNPSGWSYVHFAATWDFTAHALVPIVGWDD